MLELDKYEFARHEKYIFYCASAAAAAVASYLYYKNIIFALLILPFIKRIEGYVTNSIIE